MKIKNLISIIIVLSSIVFSDKVEAQPLMKKVKKYDFIDYNANNLLHYGDSSNMKKVYRKMDSLFLFGDEHISILHIGGSHIQADILSHQLRRNLASIDMGMGAGRGVLFPYRIAKTNAPWNYSISHKGEWTTNSNSKRPYNYQLGISGYAAQTTDSKASIELKLNRDSSQHWLFNKITMIGYASSSPIKPIAYTAHDTIYGTYDSTLCTYTFDFGVYLDSVNISFNEVSDSNSFTLSALLPENNLSGFTYHSVGVNGASVPSWLRCSNFDKELQFINPDIVIFNIGINDANMSEDRFSKERFKNNYNKLIAKVKSVVPNAAIIFITNNDCYYRVSRNYRILNKNSVKVREAFIELARMHNAAVWDMFSIMGGLNSIKQWENAGLAKSDKIHFSVDGYKLLGDMLYNALIYDYLYKK